MTKLDYPGLIGYLYLSQLRADINKYYLGTLWWFIEPILYVAVFYLIFVNFRQRDELFLYNLICGLATWKLVAASIGQGGMSIMQSKNIIANFSVNPIVFPLVSFLVNYTKYIFAIAAVVLLFHFKGVLKFAGWPQAFVWLFAFVITVFSIQLIVSLLMPFIPDLRILVGNILMLLMFMSGVIFPISAMPAYIQQFLFWNPFVHFIDGSRAVFLRGEQVDHMLLGIIMIIALMLMVIAYIRLQQLKGDIPKRII